VPPEERTQDVAIHEIRVLEEEQRQEQDDDRDCRSAFPSGIVGRELHPLHAEIGSGHQDVWQPRVFDSPPRIKHRAPRDDEPYAMWRRDDQVQAEVDDEKQEKRGRAEQHVTASKPGRR
jgi:hypothetical protein